MRMPSNATSVVSQEQSKGAASPLLSCWSCFSSCDSGCSWSGLLAGLRRKERRAARSHSRSHSPWPLHGHNQHTAYAAFLLIPISSCLLRSARNIICPHVNKLPCPLVPAERCRKLTATAVLLSSCSVPLPPETPRTHLVCQAVVRISPPLPQCGQLHTHISHCPSLLLNRTSQDKAWCTDPHHLCSTGKTIGY